MIRPLLQPSRPAYLIHFVSNKCNFRCPFCFYLTEVEQGQKTEELSLAEITKIAEQCGPLIQLSLTGGEPFLRKDFQAIADTWIQHTSPRFLTVPTNGWYTERVQAFAEQTLAAWPATRLRIVLSIEGWETEHDRLRGHEGAWQKLVETYHALLPLRSTFKNLAIDATTVMTAANQDTVPGLLRQLDEAFVFDTLSVNLVRGADVADALRTVNPDRYTAVSRWLAQRNARTRRGWIDSVWQAVDRMTYEAVRLSAFENICKNPCVAGRKLVVLDETGNLKPCEVLDEVYGNVRAFDFSIPAILASQHARTNRAWIKETGCHCSYECAQAANVVWNPARYPEVLRTTVALKTSQSDGSG